MCLVGSSRQDVSQLRVVVIDQCQPGATQEDRLVGGWGWLGVKVLVSCGGFGYHPWNFVCLAELFQSVLAVLCPLLSAGGAMPAGLGGTHAAWRSGDESDGYKLANRMGRWVQWQRGGCLADRLHMLEALLPLFVSAGGVVAPCVVQCGGVSWSSRPRSVFEPLR